MTAKEIIEKYIAFFEKRGHKRILNAPLIPENDPTTLFTSSGMQPLVPYLLGEPHPMGKKLVNVQNSFRAQDIDEVGDNHHTTFFRMLGNWSLGDYFKKEEISWLWELLTKAFGLPKEKLYITVFGGDKDSGIIFDKEAYDIWLNVLETSFGSPQKHRIFSGSVDKNWWSRSGIPKRMPLGEIGGPDTEVYYRFDELEHNKNCKGDSPVLCECGKYLEIANSVFMQYQKQKDGSFKELPQKNVDYGGGVERLMMAIENQSDLFQTNLLAPIVNEIELTTKKSYLQHAREIRIITDHLIAASFIASSGIYPSNKEQGYILRRLIRRATDYLLLLGGADVKFILLSIANQYKHTDLYLLDTKITEVIYIISEEIDRYKSSLSTAKQFIDKKYKGKTMGGEIMGKKEISADDAFLLYSTHGFSPTQIKSLGYNFNEREFAEKMEEHQKRSKKGAEKKFAGGLADHSEKTIMGHTATHLLHQALRDMFGAKLHQTGSNITSERIRFDFNYEKNLTPKEINKIEEIVNEKIRANLPVHFEMLPLAKAKEIGAIGLFNEKYSDTVKVYFIGGPSTLLRQARDRSGRLTTDEPYSIEFCGGPHVDFTSEVKSFKIFKQENIGKGNRRLYAKVG